MCVKFRGASDAERKLRNITHIQTAAFQLGKTARLSFKHPGERTRPSRPVRTSAAPLGTPYRCYMTGLMCAALDPYVGQINDKYQGFSTAMRTAA